MKLQNVPDSKRNYLKLELFILCYIPKECFFNQVKNKISANIDTVNDRTESLKLSLKVVGEDKENNDRN